MLLAVTGLVLIGSGIAYVVVAASGTLLAYETAYLGWTAEEICVRVSCRVISFMTHASTFGRSRSV